MNRYERKLKRIKDEKRRKGRKYKWIFKLLWLVICILTVILSVGIIYKSPGTAIGYVLFLSMSFVGGMFLLSIIFVKNYSWKEYLIGLIMVILGWSSLAMSWNMTMDITKYVFLNEYETKVVKIESINYRRITTEVVTDTGKYEFLFSFRRVPNVDFLEIDYLPKSKVALKVREVQE